MLRSLTIATAFLSLAVGTAAADPIVGHWKIESGGKAKITDCGDKYCVVLTNGPAAGYTIGKLNPNGDGKYSGSITDPRNQKTYSGSARLNGNSLRMTGCVLKVLCQSQTWKRL